MSNFKGMFQVCMTPFKEADQSVDFGRLEEYVESQVSSGIHGLVANASISEFPLLSGEESTEVARTIVRTARGRLPVILGATAPSTRQTVEYCRIAEDLGADGLLMLPPYYYPLDESEILRHYEVAASHTRLPIILYNNPRASGVDLLPELVAKLAEIDNVQYIKESSRLASRVHDIISLAGSKIGVFNGIDMIYFDALVSGAVGAIAASLDIIPSQMLEVYSLIVEQNNVPEARQVFDRIFPLIKHIETSGKFVPVLKAAMEIIGRPMGPPRFPLLPIAGQERERLAAVLSDLRLGPG